MEKICYMKFDGLWTGVVR